jgi:hypothetical protein
LSLLLLQDYVLVALGAHVHCSSTSKEAAVIDAEDGALWSLASSLIMRLHLLKSPAGKSP